MEVSKSQKIVVTFLIGLFYWEGSIVTADDNSSNTSVTIVAGSRAMHFKIPENSQDKLGQGSPSSSSSSLARGEGRLKRGIWSTSSRGYQCDDGCSKHQNTNYFWCRLSGEPYTWDYCSPGGGVDYYARPCSTLCSYEGKNYKWCYVGQGGSWGYCSDNNSTGRSRPTLIYFVFSAILCVMTVITNH